jgi:insulysin
MGLGIQAQDVQDFIPELLSNLHVETLIHGNATKEDAFRLTRIVQENLGAKPLDFESVEGTRSLILPPGEFRSPSTMLTFLAMKITVDEIVPNPENVNSGIEYFCQVTNVTDARNRACLHLLAQIGREKAFDFLRTKLQLGYLIWSGIRDTTTTEGFDACLCTFNGSSYRIIIQSEKPPSYLEEKIELFLDLLKEKIIEMSPADYASHVSSLVLSLSETPKFLGKETWRYWLHIDSGFYEFNRRIHPVSY